MISVSDNTIIHHILFFLNISCLKKPTQNSKPTQNCSRYHFCEPNVKLDQKQQQPTQKRYPPNCDKNLIQTYLNCSIAQDLYYNKAHI